jgi:acyl carrier protein
MTFLKRGGDMEIEEKVKEMLLSILEIESEELEEDIPFPEISAVDWDSIRALDILAAIEKEFKIRINETEMGNMDTFAKIVNFIKKKVGESEKSEARI